MEERYPPEHRVDLPRIERAVREVLAAVGEDPNREGLKGTPGRVARAYEFLFAGLGVDPTRQLSVGFRKTTTRWSLSGTSPSIRPVSTISCR